MLRISLEESPDAMVLKLEGHFAEPYVGELSRAWHETAPLLASKRLSLDVSGITHTDANGTQALRGLYAQTHASLVAGNPWTQMLARQIKLSRLQLEAEGIGF